MVMYILRGDVPRPVRTVRENKELEANCCLYVGFQLLIPPDPVNRSTSPCRGTSRTQPLACCKAPWQCLYLRPDPQGHGSLRPTFGMGRTKGAAWAPGALSITLPPALAGSPPPNSAPPLSIAPPPGSPSPGGMAWIGEIASACCA